MKCFTVTVTQETNGLLKLPLTVFTSNPKDPPQYIVALLDGGANCNLISNSRARLLQVGTIIEQGEVIFGDKSEQSVSKSMFLTLEATSGKITFTFSAKFYIVEKAQQELLIGRPTLNATGLIHLYTFQVVCAPNPFLKEVNALDIKIYDIDEPNAESEGEDAENADTTAEAFNDSTPDLWEELCTTLNCNKTQLFNTMDWFARFSTEPISCFFENFDQFLHSVPARHEMPKCTLILRREAHPDAPFEEVNKAVSIIQNALAHVWDVANRGIAKYREFHIPFDYENYVPVRVNAQVLNEPMTAALHAYLADEEKRGTIEDVPQDVLATLTTISPMYMIPKSKPNTHRLIVDSNRSNVNKYSKKISGPAPDANEHIDSICGHDVVFIADGDNFYWQIPVHIDSRKLTAFLTKFGIKQFKVLPQGHCNACPHIANVTTETIMFERIAWRNYFDDFHTFADFCRRFEVLYRLAEFHMYALRYNVKFSPAKAKLGYARAELLGFTVSKEGKAISASRTSALTALRTPKSRDDLLSFLGCFVFIMKWIDNFAELAAPLYQLLHKGIRFNVSWTSNHDAAVESLKECVKIAPILIVLDPKVVAKIRTDGSLLAISGVLFQIVLHKGIMKELAACYGSKLLSKAQRSWPIVKIEFYSIVWWCRKWKMMVQGFMIEIEIDARNLLWAQNSTNEMIRRWYHELSSFLDIVKVTHIKGEDNQPSDGLSRIVNLAVTDLNEEYSISVLECNTMELSTLERVVNDIDFDKLLKIEQDPASSNLMDGFENTEEDCVMTKGHYETICLCHNDVVGHCGVFGTISLIRRCNLHQRFESLSSLAKLVKMFVKSCPVCQLTYQLLRSRYPVTEMVMHEFFSIIDFDWVYLGLDTLGNKEALVGRDRFTRFVEIFPSTTATGEEFARYLLAIAGRYGAPAEVCMDGPQVFTSHFVDCFLDLLGTTRKTILTYRPTANPAERTIKEVIRHTRALIVDRPDVRDKWSVYVPIVTSIINNTFCVATHSTPAKMMYGDSHNHVRGILTSHGASKLRELNHAQDYSIAHGLIMAADYDFQTERINHALSMMPAMNASIVYRTGDYVVAKLPTGDRRPKLSPKFRGLFLVLKTEGNNGSSVYVRNVVNDKVEVIHAQDLYPIDLSVLSSSDEILSIAAGLVAVPEYLVSHVSDHRFTSTQHKDSIILASHLPALSFLCHYKGLPESESLWWNEYKDVSHLTLIQNYIARSRRLIPNVAADGNNLERHNVPSLLAFMRLHNIPIASRRKQDLLIAIESERRVRQGENFD